MALQNMTIPAASESIARQLLQHFAASYHVATPALAERLVQEAAKAIKPVLEQLIVEAYQP